MLTEEEKQATRTTIRSNQHEAFVMCPAMMDALAKDHALVRKIWETIRNKVELAASYGTLPGDAAKLAKLTAALGGAGRAYVKHYKGKNYIILKGFPGLRKTLTSTRYLVDNTKVMALGLGKHAAQATARAGGVLTIYFMGAYRVADYFLRDEATLTQLVGRLAVDVVKVGIAVGASLVAGAVFAAAFGVAIGPLVVVIFVGGIASLGLNELDARFKISDKVVEGLDELSRTLVDNVNQKVVAIEERIADSVAQTARAVICYTIQSAKALVIDTARHSLDRFSTPRSPW